jgi:hypothetical protein
MAGSEQFWNRQARDATPQIVGSQDCCPEKALVDARANNCLTGRSFGKLSSFVNELRKAARHLIEQALAFKR